MNDRRSIARTQMARALWYAGPGQLELRPEPVKHPNSHEAPVNTEFSGVSRGTERLILKGAVPEAEWAHMRAPLQCGEFPFPIKYGYCATGIVQLGPNELIGRRVFCLHPHQDVFNAPIEMLVPVPECVAAKRAVLAANMETALNGHWDAGSGPGDTIAVVGAGVVGLLVAAVACGITGSQTHVIDPNPARRDIAQALGATFHTEAPSELGADVVFHTSASDAGLSSAIALCGVEAKLIEMSWFGDQKTSVPLGGAFHRKRLQIISSQVGHVSPSRRIRWSYRRRLEMALTLLADPIFDQMVTEEIAFEDAPVALPKLLMRENAGLAPVIRYPGDAK
ncbi:MAG: zinc-binding alcohol dehydrogenase [Pseudomonadota bacterium]